jgi:hypothetical protein
MLGRGNQFVKAAEGNNARDNDNVNIDYTISVEVETLVAVFFLL